MKTNRAWLFLVLLVVALVGDVGARPERNIKLVRDLMIGGPDSNELFLWTSVSTDRDDNLYFADALDCSIKKFGPDGRFLKKAGGKGRGPGEFDKTVGVAALGESVYAWDVYGRAIQVFDRELVYQRTLPMAGNVNGLGELPDGRLAAVVRASIGLPIILVFMPDGTKIRTITLAAPSEASRIDSIGLATDPSGDYYLGYLFSDRIEKRSAAGELVWAKKPLGGGPTAAPDLIQGLKVPSETCVLSLALDGRGRLYVLGGRKTAHPGRDVFIFLPDGTAAGSFLLPEPSHSLYFDRRNRLYVSADGGVTMKRYLLVFE